MAFGILLFPQTPVMHSLHIFLIFQIKRRNEFSDIRAQVVALWAEIGAHPADAFEEVVADESMRLTKENLLGVKVFVKSNLPY